MKHGVYPAPVVDVADLQQHIFVAADEIGQMPGVMASKRGSFERRLEACYHRLFNENRLFSHSFEEMHLFHKHHVF